MRLKTISPILWTKDLAATTEFYTTVLSFSSRSNFPNFVSLFINDIDIMFVLPQDEPEDCEPAENKEPFFPKPMLTGSIYITTDEVDAIWTSVQGKAQIKMPIGDRDYFMRDFSILDNNGYEICFGQNTSYD